MVKVIDEKLLDNISLQASLSPRLRMNYNFHEHLDANVQKLMNALEPGTVVPVHRHLHTSETYIILRGSLIVKLYNDQAEMIENVKLKAGAESIGIDIPAGQWHTLEVLESGTVIFEIKEGPYKALEPSDILDIASF